MSGAAPTDPLGVRLLARAAELVAIPSVSLDEGEIADHVEARLRENPALRVDRLGNNVVARTDTARDTRLVVAGHLDTVPPHGNDEPLIDGDRLSGLGSCDMKGTLAVMLDLAVSVTDPQVDVTWVFYEAEEIAGEHNGLRRLFDQRPDLVVGDVAILGEPTSAAVEAGCQGGVRIRATYRGRRAHTARPWMGDNAIHRLTPVLNRLAGYEARCPVLEGCEYQESLQAVFVDGGVAGNVVPDEATITVHHRFAPDRTGEQAREFLLGVLEGYSEVELLDLSPAAPPAVEHPLIHRLIEADGLEVRAKLGWTDVARFAEHGIPAVNFGAGDPALAHTSEEFVTGEELARVHRALGALLQHGPA